MRATLDANFLASAFLAKSGFCDEILQLMVIRGIEIVLCGEIIAEFKNVLSRKEVKKRFDYSNRNVDYFVWKIKKTSNIIKLESHFKVVKDDPADDIIINCAYDGKVDYMISSDKHLKRLKGFKGIQILSPKEFFDILVKDFDVDDIMISYFST